MYKYIKVLGIEVEQELRERYKIIFIRSLNQATIKILHEF